MRNVIIIGLVGIAVASCVGAPPERQPLIVPKTPTVTPAPPARPATIQQPNGHWTDWPLANGSWVYRRDDRGSIALFGASTADALVTLRCDTGRRALFLSRAGNVGSTMVVRTSSTSKTLGLQSTGGQPAYVATSIAPTDPILDAMAFTRGRIALEVDGAQNIAIPIWSEVGRVVEDCRA
jgi:hypothetical protein